MQDDTPNRSEDVLAWTFGQLPTPSPRSPVSSQALARLSDAGLVQTRRRYEEAGVGPILDGTAMLLAPDSLDVLVPKFELAGEGDQLIALTATSLAVVFGISLHGKLIMIDPIVGLIHVVHGSPAADDPIAFQMKMAEEIGALQIQLQFDEPQIDLAGEPLHEVLSVRLGPLSFEECYGATLSIEEEQAFDSSTWRIWKLTEYILSRHADAPFERTDFTADR